MNKIKLPDFVTFKNFNEVLDLISKKELELNKLHSALSFKKFMSIFELNSGLKSLTLKGDYMFGEHILSAVSTTYFNGRVVKENESMFNLLTDILGCDNLKRILAMDGLVIGRGVGSCNKLKEVFDIKNFSDEDVDKMVGNNISLMDSIISDGFDNINNLKQQVLVVGLLRLFKKYPYLKRISLKINGILIGSQTSTVDVLLSDNGEDSAVIINEIQSIVLNKKFQNPIFLHHNYVSVNINKDALPNIRKLIKCVDCCGVSLDNFSKVLEREILEENISKNIIENKDSKMKI